MSEEKGYTYRYPRPALTADCVIFGYDNGLKILLIERGIEPFKGMWALPGGFMKMEESIEECARRELREETSMQNVYMEQFRTYSTPGRDPRGRVVTVAFIALVRPGEYNVIGGDDASMALWFDVTMLPPLAFDHSTIIREAREHLKEILKLKPIAFKLVDHSFSVDEIRRVYEAINNTTYDRRNFQRKLIQTGIIEEQPAIASDTDGCFGAAPVPDTSSISMDHLTENPFNVPDNVVFEREADMESQLKAMPAKFSKITKASKASRPEGAGRRGKLYRIATSMLNRITGEDDEPEEDASIKDIFNF